MLKSRPFSPVPVLRNLGHHSLLSPFHQTHLILLSRLTPNMESDVSHFFVHTCFRTVLVPSTLWTVFIDSWLSVCVDSIDFFFPRNFKKNISGDLKMQKQLCKPRVSPAYSGWWLNCVFFRYLLSGPLGSFLTRGLCRSGAKSLVRRRQCSLLQQPSSQKGVGNERHFTIVLSKFLGW